MIGLPLDEANGDIIGAKLTPTPALGDPARKPDQKPGRVYATSPDVGDMVALGSSVTLIVYGPRPTGQVPEVSGMSIEAATDTLGEL